MVYLYLLVILLCINGFIRMMALAKIYEKLKINSLLAFIPILNVYPLIKKFNLPVSYNVLLFIPVVSLYVRYDINTNLSNYFGKEKSLLLTFLPFVFFPIFVLDLKEQVTVSEFFEIEDSIYKEEEKKEEIVQDNEEEVEILDLDIPPVLKIEKHKAKDNNYHEKYVEEIKVPKKEEKIEKKIDYKVCPKCKNRSRVEALKCLICGYVFKE